MLEDGHAVMVRARTAHIGGREGRSRRDRSDAPHPCHGLRNSRACIRNHEKVKGLVLSHVLKNSKTLSEKFVEAFDGGERIPQQILKLIPVETEWDVVRRFLREYGNPAEPLGFE